MSDVSSDEQLPGLLGSVVAQIAASQPDSEETQSVVELLKRNPPAETAVQLAEFPKVFPRRLMLVTGVTAAAVFLMVSLGRSSAAGTLEVLADALRLQSCIKMTSTHDGKTREAWIMPDLQQSATRTEDWIEHFDARAETVTTYNRKTGELVRSTRHQTDFGFVSDLVSAIVACGKGNGPDTVRGMKVVSSKVELKQGQRLLTLKLKPNALRGASHGDTATATITIDPSTELPRKCVAKLVSDGRVQMMIDVWTYPKEGPANVFELGVDLKTQLIDRVPPTDVKPLLAGVYSGRVKFDDYCAVTIQSSHEIPNHYAPGDIVLAAKQGLQFLFARYHDSLDQFQGKTRAEVASLILADPGRFSWKALTIIDGKTEYHFHSGGFTPSQINLPLDEYIVPSWHSVPHFAGRPPLGVGRGDVASAIVTRTDGGPEGCVLLQTIHGGTIPEAPIDPDVRKRIMKMLKGGYWVRGDRDYLVMQQDSEFEDNRTVSFTLNTLAQSPKGFWYPTSATQPDYVSAGNTISASYYSYHLDFNRKLPASMFSPASYQTK